MSFQFSIFRFQFFKILFTSFATSFVLLLLAILISEWTIVRSSKNYIFDSLEQVPDSQTILVLGTSPYLSGGGRNAFYVNRMLATKDLYNAGKAKNIIVSGDNRKHNYNEPQAMQRSLIELNIPKEVIYLDYAGFRTLDSVIRTNKVFGQDSFVIVSQKFHNERAVYIARKNGLKAFAYNAKDVPARYNMKTFVRERFARVKVFIDILTKKEPKFLGEPIEVRNTLDF